MKKARASMAAIKAVRSIAAYKGIIGRLNRKMHELELDNKYALEKERHEKERTLNAYNSLKEVLRMKICVGNVVMTHEEAHKLRIAELTILKNGQGGLFT